MSPPPAGGPAGWGSTPPRWLGPPVRIGGQYGVPPQFQAAQNFLTAHLGGGPASNAGVGYTAGLTHPITQVPGTGGGSTNSGGGGTLPQVDPGVFGLPGGPKPPWWDAFQTYLGSRFPHARNWFGPPAGGNTGGGPPGNWPPPNGPAWRWPNT